MNKVKCLTKIILYLTAVFTLTGCASNQIPELTDEQTTAISEYAAMTLLKYDVNSRSRLVSREEVAEYDAKQLEIEQKRLEREQREAEKEDASNDVSVTDSSEPEEVMPNYSINDFYELNGVDIEFQDYLVCDSYPQDEDAYVTVDASEGKKLLILRFSITNLGMDQTVSLHDSSMTARIKINDSVSKNAYITLITDDITTYHRDMAQGDTDIAVLVTEFETYDLESIESIKLTLKNDLKDYTIILK